MSYLTEDQIAQSPTMRARVAQCAAGEGVEGPDSWAQGFCREWAAAPGWDEAWTYALAVNPDDDPGADPAVITDGMILSQVQAMLASQEA